MDDVDWAGLKHAYGNAGDIPELLRLLAAPDAGTRRRALIDVYGSLCHQGSVSLATAAAVPYVAALAADVQQADRVELLRFLGAVCHGGDAALPMVRQAIAGQLPLLLNVLDDADPAVRVQVLWTLAAPELATATAQVMARTSDPEPAVRAVAWLCLAVYPAAPVPAEHLDVEDAVRLAWALAATARGRAGLAGEVVALVGAAEVLKRLYIWCNEVPECHPLEHCLPLLRTREPQVLEALCAALRREDDAECESHAVALLGVLLNGTFPRRQTPLDPDDIDARQRHVLSSIAASEACWWADRSWDLDQYGIMENFSREDFVAAYGDDLLVRRASIVTPRQVPAAAEVAVQLGRDAWLDAPFVFLNVGSDQIDEVIPERPEDFPPEVMADFRRIAAKLPDRPLSCLEAFYPQLTLTQARDVFTDLGYQLERS